MFRRSDDPLTTAHDVAALDLDGVVYVGPAAVAGAPEHLRAAAEAGLRLAYITNNAARTPDEVGDHLRSLGIDVVDHDVVTSAQAAARLLAARVPSGARVFLLGGPGLEQALRDRGLEPVTDPRDEPAAVVQGYGPEMPWRRVVQGAILVRHGLPWVASNTDMTIPTATGIGPGNGTLVELVARFAERRPEVAGKPEPALFEETAERMEARQPLVVGDRLDTDIAGAERVGWPSLLVMTGVTGPAELAAARPEERPTYVAADLGGLLTPHPEPEQHDGDVRLGGWTARVDQGRAVVDGAGSVDDWWRVLATAVWRHRDESGGVADTSGLAVPTTSGG